MVKTLYETIQSVTKTAVAVLGDATKFPADWLFCYRWGKSKTKGQKDKNEINVLPNGELIKHITVGGRTSAVVETRQKKIYREGESEQPAKTGRKAKGKEVGNNTEKETQVEGGKEVNGKRKVGEEEKEENTTPRKRRVSEKQENGESQGTLTRKSPRSKA
jgi:formamidopyrimidine-DNA glycosylase